MRHSGLLLACALGILLSGCATTPSSPVAAKVVTQPSRLLNLIRVRAEQRGDSVVVSGRVARRTMMTGSVRGHLHVEAVAGETVLSWADTQWSRLARRRLPTSDFHAELPLLAGQATEIRVSHMLTKHDAPKRSGNP